jgi:universal stress protein A
MIRIKKILVATDFGPASETALNYGRELARDSGAALILLHVTENLYATAATGYGYAYVSMEVQKEIETSAQERTDALLTDDDRRTLHAQAITVTLNPPATAIVQYARANDVDLIVVGTHGRGALAHAFMGSVAERVVRTAPCPVLTVRSLEHEFVFPDAIVAVARA